MFSIIKEVKMKKLYCVIFCKLENLKNLKNYTS